MKKVFSILTLAAILTLTGCVHHTPFEEEYFFQAMGKDGEIVITADTTKLKEKPSPSIRIPRSARRPILPTSPRSTTTVDSRATTAPSRSTRP